MIELKSYGRWYHFEKPIDSRLEKAIDKKLSYMKKGSQFMPDPLWAKQRLYSLKTRSFPDGLLYLVIPILDQWKNKFNEGYHIDYGNTLTIYNVDTSNLRDYQKEALNVFKREQSGLFNISVAGGKTLLGERILASVDPSIDKLVLVPTKELQKQWQDELQNVITISNQVKSKCDILTYQKCVVELKKNKNFLKEYELVICDESHKIAAKTFYKVGMACTNARIIGLTGTPKRTDGEDMKIQAVVGPIVYTAQIKELTDKNYLTPVTINIINSIPKFKPTPDMNYTDIYNAGIVNKNDRNVEICRLAEEYSKNGMVLVLFDKIEHGDKLKSIFDQYASPNKKIAYIHGTIKDRDTIFDDIKKGKYKIILASRIFNEGINLPELKTLIIASAGKSPIRLVQQIGRVLRLHESKERAQVYDFEDWGKNLRQHFKERLKIYKENGFEVKYEP